MPTTSIGHYNCVQVSLPLSLTLIGSSKGKRLEKIRILPLEVILIHKPRVLNNATIDIITKW